MFAYLTDLLTAGHEGARHLGEVSDAIIGGLHVDGFKPSANPMVGAGQGLQHLQGHRHPE